MIFDDEEYWNNIPDMKAVDIKWCVDSDDCDIELPTEIVIPAGMTDEDMISDYLSDVTGFCHEGFNLQDL